MFDFGVGLDICGIERMIPLLKNERFLSRVLTEGERAYLAERGGMAASSLAAMFAAKEALLKSVGLGIRLPLNEIEIVHAESGQPSYRLHGQAQAACPGVFRLSVTHENGIAAAVCVWVNHPENDVRQNEPLCENTAEQHESGTTLTEEEMFDSSSKSLYESIEEAVVDGELPEEFALPKADEDASALVWADGAEDGVFIYHMRPSQPDEDALERMKQAVRAASDGNFDAADVLFAQLGKQTRALSMIDALEGYIIDASAAAEGLSNDPAAEKRFSPRNIYAYGLHLLAESQNRECVKFGFSMLEVFDTDDHAELKKMVRTIGLSDEFTLFAVYLMQHWQDGNREIWELAKRTHGWGRIHAVERLEAESEEIKRWLLLEGVHNHVMTAYSALACWRKSDAERILQGNPTREEFSGLRDIIDGLMDEGSVWGISHIERAKEHMLRFLSAAWTISLEIRDYEVIRTIRTHYQEKQTSDEKIVDLCRRLLSTEDCRQAVRASVKEGKNAELAEELGIDYRPDFFARMQNDFEHAGYLCSYLMDDAAYKDDVLALFRQKLPLCEFKARPTEELGLGKQYWKENALGCLLRTLKSYPLKGKEFVAAGLQSAPIITRNIALSVLEAWCEAAQKPLSSLLPEMHSLLRRLRDVEPSAGALATMDALIEGKTTADGKQEKADSEL